LTVALWHEMMKAGSNQQRNNQPMTGAANAGGGWLQDHLRTAVDNWQQKRPATRALVVTRQCAMLKVGSSSGQQCNNQPTTGGAKGGGWLVLRPLEGCG
jgi:hypothetical protein